MNSGSHKYNKTSTCIHQLIHKRLGRTVLMRPYVQQPISKDKNVMARTRKYYLKNHYLTLRSKVITVRDTPPYDYAPTYQISLTYLERQKCYGPDKKILFKKPLFDLEVKVPRRSLRYVTHHLMVMHPHTKYH